ncbi:hypothetical protein B0H67DRAFT_553974 [Lasiosphaeris hirsuta]|uniref:Uncharacterized protein n=1 Tax=Lasiosphaeris hirsuta TaxID=260670 RepID=A0AA40AGM8_9PEZI|nr:hypothetical protein B0H67DRAFT_553974 [Lasiosphaeris hirsuta]
MLGHRVATIYVGKDRVEWLVHENLLHSISLDGYNSDYMSRLFATYMYAQDYEGAIDLPELDPVEFEAYVRRLYRDVFVFDGATPKEAMTVDDSESEGGSSLGKVGRGKEASVKGKGRSRSSSSRDLTETLGAINRLDEIRTRPMLLGYITSESQDRLLDSVTRFAMPYDPSLSQEYETKDITGMSGALPAPLMSKHKKGRE